MLTTKLYVVSYLNRIAILASKYKKFNLLSDLYRSIIKIKRQNFTNFHFFRHGQEYLVTRINLMNVNKGQQVLSPA